MLIASFDFISFLGSLTSIGSLATLVSLDPLIISSSCLIALGVIVTGSFSTLPFFDGFFYSFSQRCGAYLFALIGVLHSPK